MTQPATKLEDRVTRLENQMAEVTYLAPKNDRDASNLKATLHGHTGVLNAIGETLREHGLKLAEHGTRLDRLERRVDEGFARMDEGFHQVNENFDVIERRFGVVQAGIVRITNLLTEPGQEPR